MRKADLYSRQYKRQKDNLQADGYRLTGFRRTGVLNHLVIT